MKKMIVTACAAIASAVALASTVESSNTFGVLKVSTGNAANLDASARKQFVISIPWEAVGTAGSPINPTSLILASGLNNGDMLYVYGAASGDTTKSFGAWMVSSSAWTTTGVSTESGEYTTGADATVARGLAVVVETAKDYIYLSGQYANTSADVIVAAATGSGSNLTPKYTLIGGNLAQDLNVNALTYSGEPNKPNKNDLIFLDAGTVYTRNSDNTAWQKESGETVTFTLPDGKTQGTMPQYTTTNVTIPAGRGAWYVRYGTEALTITMPAVAAN